MIDGIFIDKQMLGGFLVLCMQAILKEFLQAMLQIMEIFFAIDIIEIRNVAGPGTLSPRASGTSNGSATAIFAQIFKIGCICVFGSCAGNELKKE